MTQNPREKFLKTIMCSCDGSDAPDHTTSNPEIIMTALDTLLEEVAKGIDDTEERATNDYELGIQHGLNAASTIIRKHKGV